MIPSRSSLSGHVLVPSPSPPSPEDLSKHVRLTLLLPPSLLPSPPSPPAPFPTRLPVLLPKELPLRHLFAAASVLLGSALPGGCPPLDFSHSSPLLPGDTYESACLMSGDE
ncbi:hypothetical protein TeGR_g11477, partial [Tetraparma gracilis]